MTTTIQLDRMSREEKLLAMEAIWADLVKDDGALESPSWHGEALKETEARLAAGQEAILDWPTAKRALRTPGG
jgi:hypothetical protein